MRINLRNIFIGNPVYKGRYHSYDWECLLGKYKSIVRKDMTVVEIGSSNSQKTRDLAKYCGKLIGIEIDKNKIVEPRADNVEIINADWQDLSSFIAPESVDIVISSHVIEHVPDDLKALNETYRVLKKGGCLLLITPNKTRLTRFVAELLCLRKFFIYKEHMREYADRDIFGLISKSKFTNFVYRGLLLGFHSGKFMFYFKVCPRVFRKLANFWEVQLVK